VAFEANAEDRETRGFISMTTMRPSRIHAELNIRSACIDPNFADHGNRSVAHCLVFTIGKGLRRGDVIESPVCTPWDRNSQSSR